MAEISRRILEEAAAGNSRAFAEIYRAASGFVYTLALRVSGDSSSAEEITQDVFLRVHSKIKTFAFRSSFKTWLYRVTINAALNAAKKNNREKKRRKDENLDGFTHPDWQKARKNMEEEDRKRLLEEALRVLTPGQRACLVLREIEGLSYRRIARTAGLNINTVRSRLRRSRRILLERSKIAKNKLPDY